MNAEKKTEKKTDKPAADQCEICDALCCKYIGVPLDDPETWGEFSDLEWFLHHEGISIYVEDDDWYMNIETRCKMLDEKNQCKIYDKRPRICRNHKHDECEFDGRPYEFDIHFHTADELRKYANKFMREKYRGKPKRRKKASAKKTAKKKK